MTHLEKTHNSYETQLSNKASINFVHGFPVGHDQCESAFLHVYDEVLVLVYNDDLCSMFSKPTTFTLFILRVIQHLCGHAAI